MTEQTKAVAKVAEPSALMVRLADKYGLATGSLQNTLMATIMSTLDRKPTPDEFLTFCIIADQYGLNPFLKQLYAFPKRGGGVEIIVPIDGWSALINGHPQHDGISVEESGTVEDQSLAVTVTIHRKDRSHPTVFTEHLSECYRNTEPWNGMPRRMTRHKGIIQTARIAFGFSGIVDPDEAERIDEAEQARTIEVQTDGPAVRTLADATADLAERLEVKPDKTAGEGRADTGSDALSNTPSPVPTCGRCGSEDHDTDQCEAEAEPTFFDPDATEDPG